MPSDDEMYVELRTLCKGSGLRDGAVGTRIGPLLQRLAGITELHTHNVARQKLSVTLRLQLYGYTEDRTKVLEAVLGLHPDAPQSTLDRRLDWLAEQLHCSRRTVARLYEKALRQFAHDAAVAVRLAASAHAVGYAVTQHESTLRLDLARPEETERQRIKVTEEKLDVIVRRFSVVHRAGLSQDFEFDVVDGGSLLGIERQPGDHDLILCRIQLPRTLRRGETYEYTAVYRFPDGQPVAPYLVVQPFTPYEAAALAVCFPRDRLPSSVHLIDGVTPYQIKNHRPAGRQLHEVEPGRYEAAFPEIPHGRVFGLGWGRTP